MHRPDELEAFGVTDNGLKAGAQQRLIIGDGNPNHGIGRSRGKRASTRYPLPSGPASSEPPPSHPLTHPGYAETAGIIGCQRPGTLFVRDDDHDFACREANFNLRTIRP